MTPNVKLNGAPLLARPLEIAGGRAHNNTLNRPALIYKLSNTKSHRGFNDEVQRNAAMIA
jgi:hypothetical protein